MRDAVSGNPRYHFDKMHPESAAYSQRDKNSVMPPGASARDNRAAAHSTKMSEPESKTHDTQRYRFNKILDDFIDKRQPSNFFKEDTDDRSHHYGSRDAQGRPIGGSRDGLPRDVSGNRGDLGQRGDDITDATPTFRRGQGSRSQINETDPRRGADKPVLGPLQERGQAPKYQYKARDRRSDELSYDEDQYTEQENGNKLKASSKFAKYDQDGGRGQPDGFRQFKNREDYQGTHYQTSSDLHFPSPTSNLLRHEGNRDYRTQPSGREPGQEGLPVSGFDHTKLGSFTERGRDYRPTGLTPKKPSNLASMIPNHDLAKKFGEPKPSHTLDSAFHHFRMRQVQVQEAPVEKSFSQIRRAALQSSLPEEEQRPQYWQVKASVTEDADIKRILGKIKRAEVDVHGNPITEKPIKEVLGFKAQTPQGLKGGPMEKTSFNLSATSPRSPYMYGKIETGQQSSARIQSSTPRPAASSKLLNYSSNRKFPN